MRTQSNVPRPRHTFIATITQRKICPIYLGQVKQIKRIAMNDDEIQKKPENNKGKRKTLQYLV